jgi:hypothetical protein
MVKVILHGLSPFSKLTDLGIAYHKFTHYSIPVRPPLA